MISAIPISFDFIISKFSAFFSSLTIIMEIVGQGPEGIKNRFRVSLFFELSLPPLKPVPPTGLLFDLDFFNKILGGNNPARNSIFF